MIGKVHIAENSAEPLLRTVSRDQVGYCCLVMVCKEILYVFLQDSVIDFRKADFLGDVLESDF